MKNIYLRNIKNKKMSNLCKNNEIEKVQNHFKYEFELFNIMIKDYYDYKIIFKKKMENVLNNEMLIIKNKNIQDENIYYKLSIEISTIIQMIITLNIGVKFIIEENYYLDMNEKKMKFSKFCFETKNSECIYYYAGLFEKIINDMNIIIKNFNKQLELKAFQCYKNNMYYYYFLFHFIE